MPLGSFAPLVKLPFGDPVFLALVAGMVLFFFFIFLMIRRTLTGFREGMDRGRE